MITFLNKFKYIIWLLALILFTAGYVFIEIPVAAQGDVDGFIAYLDEYIPRNMQRHGVAGVGVGLMHEGEVVFTKGYGYADAANTIPVDENTVFQIASISKPMTAWGVMHLVEAGKLDLDVPVSKYLTRWQLPASTEYDNDMVTIRRLLSHSAGVVGEGGYAGFASAADMQTLEESLTSAEDAGGQGFTLHSQPDTKYSYSGTGFTLLQLVVEEVSGRPFQEYMWDEILQPLGMYDSSFELNEEQAKKLSVVYGESGGPEPARYFTARAAAGLYTTAADLLTWESAMMLAQSAEPGGGVLQADTLREMYSPQPGLPTRLAYGLGYMVQSFPAEGNTEVAHTGSNLPGWSSLITTIPEKGEGLVVLANSPGGIVLRLELRRAWYRWQTGHSSFGLLFPKFLNGLVRIVPVGLLGFLLIFIVSKITGKRKKSHTSSTE